MSKVPGTTRLTDLRPRVMTAEQARSFFRLCEGPYLDLRIGVLRADWFDAGWYYLPLETDEVHVLATVPADPRELATEQHLTCIPATAAEWQAALHRGENPVIERPQAPEPPAEPVPLSSWHPDTRRGDAHGHAIRDLPQ